MSKLPFLQNTEVEVIPNGLLHLEEDGRLYLRLEQTAITEKIEGLCAIQGWEHGETTGVFWIRANSGSLNNILLLIGQVVSPNDRRSISLIVEPYSQRLQFSDYFDIVTLETCLARMQGHWLLRLIQTGSLVTYFQPILDLKAGGALFGHECLLRGIDPDGTVISPGRLFTAAQDAHLCFQIDQVARRYAVQGTVSHQPEGKIFLNFDPASIYDPAFSLSGAISSIDRAGFPHDKFVMEVVRTDEIRDVAHLNAVLKHFQSEGFALSLDNVGSGFNSFSAMQQLQPDFIKLDSHLIIGVSRDPYRAALVSQILEAARALGIRSIVQGIESVEDKHWSEQNGADMAQGFFFGHPAAEPVRQATSTECPWEIMSWDIPPPVFTRTGGLDTRIRLEA